MSDMNSITVSKVGDARKGSACSFRNVNGVDDHGDDVNMRAVWFPGMRCKFTNVYEPKLKLTLVPDDEVIAKTVEWDAALGKAVASDARFPYKPIVTLDDTWGPKMEVVAYGDKLSVYDARGEGPPVKVPGTLEQHKATLKGEYLKIRADVSSLTQYSTNGGASKLTIKVRVVVIENPPEQEPEQEDDDLCGYTPTNKRGRDESTTSPSKRQCQ